MISFARSGSSPEIRAAISLANENCSEILHFVTTCNPSGKMIEAMDLSKDYLLLLPEEANDKGLAMTGSFTGMLLAGYMITRMSDMEMLEKDIDLIAAYGDSIIKNHLKSLHDMSALDFDRAIIIGSGPLLGAARESHLKVQELTNGKVM